MNISVVHREEPRQELVAKLYDRGEYEYFDVVNDAGACLASFAIGIRGEEALFLWTIHKPSMALFRRCKSDAFPLVKEWCVEMGVKSLVCGTGDPQRDPDFDRVSSFFGFKPVARAAAMEL